MTSRMTNDCQLSSDILFNELTLFVIVVFCSLLIESCKSRNEEPLASVVDTEIQSIDFCGKHYSCDRRYYIRCFQSISDLTPLSNCNSVENVFIHAFVASPIDVDYSQFRSNIKELIIGTANDADLSPLAKFDKLEKLVIKTQNTDLSPLSGLGETLTYLEIKTENTDLSPLGASGRQLKHLKISTANTDLSPLRGLGDQLTELKLAIGENADAGFLSSCRKLKKLTIYSDQLTWLPDLSALTELEELRIEMSVLVSLAPLSGLKNLKSIYITKTPIKDLTFFSGMKNLEVITFKRVYPKESVLFEMDYFPLTHIKNLKRINFDFGSPQSESFIKLWEVFPQMKTGSNMVQ